MSKSLLFPSLLFLACYCLVSVDAASSACPIDFSYVETFPWDKSLCLDNQTQCCQSLLSVFGIGLAQHLKDTNMFQLPNAISSSDCIRDFQTKLTALSLQQSLALTCFNDTNAFAIKASSCAGIVTRDDWVQRVGATSQLDEFCKGDVSGLTTCSSCLAAGMKVTSQLVSFDKNASDKCFYFTVLYAAGIVNELGPDDTRTASCILGLQLADSAIGKMSKGVDSKHFKLIFGVVVGAFAAAMVLLGLVMVYRFWNKRQKHKEGHVKFVSHAKATLKPHTGAIWFQIGELKLATDGFSQRNLIGQGGYGVVYKGTLSDGTMVAVKKIMDLDSKRDEEFFNEVEIISTIKHRNLLPLRGCCATSDDLEGKQRYLVYDYMPKGSLDDHLFDSKVINNSKSWLSWPQRKNIIIDVAKGLAYLHHGIKPAIYHRDIKATNILLDDEMKARVADFGLAKQCKEDQSHLTTRVAGTYGYLAPEYALYGQLTEKSDVYSFGIVILETMSGRKVLDMSSPTSLLITDWAWMLTKSGHIAEVLDASMRDGGPRGVMERFVLVGILCAHVMVALRPTISEALKMLEGDIDIPRLPDRPLPLSHESFRSSLLSSRSTTTSLR
ncbi:hypothetical protein IFM89_018228 [Coptis chinensis]|uniref:non-specific serine/threonine protein kinase n=1 Tax=Coptis chinensis TaxID=261450 RepID=A0A835I159_9MAGN|nr:hypothetical protein IFM89_018228 [Coptis chinensis]